MGLGKTVQMISLILTDNERKGGSGSDNGATLIVAPLSVMSNWEQQIKLHVKAENALKVYRYHGSGRKGNFLGYDVVITSYGKLIGSNLFIYFITGAKTGT